MKKFVSVLMCAVAICCALTSCEKENGENGQDNQSLNIQLRALAGGGYVFHMVLTTGTVDTPSENIIFAEQFTGTGYFIPFDVNCTEMINETVPPAGRYKVIPVNERAPQDENFIYNRHIIYVENGEYKEDLMGRAKGVVDLSYPSAGKVKVDVDITVYNEEGKAVGAPIKGSHTGNLPKID